MGIPQPLEYLRLLRYNIFMTQSIEVRTIQPSDTSEIFALELAYAGVFPGAIVVPAELYLSPGFHGGQDVFLAWRGKELLGYAPHYFQAVDCAPNLPHRAWVEIKAKPGLAAAEVVKDVLLERLLERSQALAAEHPGRPVRMAFQYNPNEAPAIAYVQSRGFEKAESLYGMRRDLTLPIAEAPTPRGITLRRWRMETEAEQAVYVSARNECFPEAPTDLRDWQYFLGSQEWANGMMISAFDGDELTGCVLAYWPGSSDDPQAGYTEYIFTRPAWRGRGIARAMITEAMHYLKEHGKQAAKLEVLALNEGALGVYRGLGYQVLSESSFYAKTVHRTQF
jgi:ribosomal protein S18 acetylase RimI-like enzyme